MISKMGFKLFLFCGSFMLIRVCPAADLPPVQVSYWDVPSKVEIVTMDYFGKEMADAYRYLLSTQYSRRSSKVDLDWSHARIGFSKSDQFLEVPLKNGPVTRIVEVEYRRGSRVETITLISSPLVIHAPDRGRVEDFLRAARSGREIECTIFDYVFGCRTYDKRCQTRGENLGQASQCSYGAE